MENFFYNEKFYTDIPNLMDDLEIEDEKDLMELLPSNWNEKIELSTLEPIFDIDMEYLYSLICNANEHRIGENYEEAEENQVKKALKESIDFDKLTEMLPKFYFPNNDFRTITKDDLRKFL